MLGGARSGKSSFAEQLVRAAPGDWVYIATGEAWDDEMRDRIARHREERGERWRTVEEPRELTNALIANARPNAAILVDCLTLWLTNLMMAERNIDKEGQQLTDYLPNLPGSIVLVSNEVGMSIVPENAMARAFRDHAGRLHQSIAAVADEVHLVAAGLPLKLKG